MMVTKKKRVSRQEAAWPPAAGEEVTFWSDGLLHDGTLKEVKWGLVWRDFLLEDGRVIAEHRIVGAPKMPEWRDPMAVPPTERKALEKRLKRMAESGADPTDRDQVFWADLTQYVAYTYLRFGGEVPESMVEVWGRLKKH